MATRYPLDEDERPSAAVVRAMAAEAGCAPLDLKPLGTIVDPDALDSTVESDACASVTFRHAGAEITVTNGAVVIRDDTERDPSDRHEGREN